MADFCAGNERIKHAYFAFLREARGRDPSTVDGVAMAIARFEEDTGYKPFTRFHHEQAIAFKRHLGEQVNRRHGDPLSRSTMLSTLNALKAFFLWLAEQPGYRGRFPRSEAEYFSLPANDARIAKAIRSRPVPTLDQVKGAMFAMPSVSDIEKRDQALVAFSLLSGARVGAIISLRLKHVDLIDKKIHQDAKEVHTKFRKSMPTDFFAVGDDIVSVVGAWVARLTELGFGPDDPLFPATRTVIESDGERHFRLDHRAWTQTTPVRRIFQSAFDRVELPYSNPHTIRKTLVALAFQRRLPPEQMKAWSQNLGHERMLTTYLNYGEISPERQTEIMRHLAQPRAPDAEVDEMARQLIEAVRQEARRS